MKSPITVNENGFDIDTTKMEVWLDYQFEYDGSKYEVRLADDGSIQLQEVG